MLKNLLITTLCVSVLSGCVEREESKVVDAKVIEKDYDAPKTKTKRVNGKTKTTKTKAEYDVMVSYTVNNREITEEFDDRKLYDSVKVGSKVKVKYVKGFDEDDKLIVEKLELIN